MWFFIKRSPSGVLHTYPFSDSKIMLYGDSCLATLGDPVLSGGNAERARNAANGLHRQLSKVQNYRRQLVPSLVMQNSGNSNEITKKTVEKSRERLCIECFWRTILVYIVHMGFMVLWWHWIGFPLGKLCLISSSWVGRRCIGLVLSGNRDLGIGWFSDSCFCGFRIFAWWQLGSM